MILVAKRCGCQRDLLEQLNKVSQKNVYILIAESCMTERRTSEPYLLRNRKSSGLSHPERRQCRYYTEKHKEVREERKIES